MAGKTRSPHYPALSLPQALEYARRLWDREQRAPMSHGAAASSMDFKSLSGPARVAIGTLRQYGLIDKVDKGHIKLSPLGIRTLLGEPAEKEAAISEAALTPALFKELAQTHSGASETNIRSHLIIRKGFVEDGARKAARAFRETVGLAKPNASGYTSANGGSEAEDMQVSDTGQNIGAAGAGGGKPADGVFSLNVPFSKGTISVQVRVTGDAISPAHLARVRKYLELAESEWDGEQE